MQEYYNQISNQKRIAFIDGLSDIEAKELSNQYKFAVCFASKEEFPVIWFDGKRYGHTGVNQNAISIGDTYLRLYIDENGILGLTTENASFSIYPSTNQTITTSYLDVRATIPNSDYSKLTWTLSNSGTSGKTFKFNNSNGNTISEVQSVRVIPNDTSKPVANKGSINLVINQGTQSTANGKITLESTFTKDTSTNENTYKTDLKATYESLTPKQITITYRNSVEGLSVGTWSWNIPTLPEGITTNINNTGNKSTITFTNNTTSDYTINGGIIKVSNNNADNIRNNDQFTIPGKLQQTTYYWYVGQTQQNNISSNPTIVNDNTSEGWRKITEAVSTYTANSPLFNSSNNIITFTGKAATSPSYIYLPKSYVDAGLAMYDDFGNDPGLYISTNRTITVGSSNTVYYEYSRTTRHVGFGGILIYKK